VRQTIRLEGVRAFYKSYFTQVGMNIPFQSTHLVTYDYLQSLMNPTREYNPLTHSICGALAGALAAALTTPLDVCKTLINTQECCTQIESCPVKAAKLKQLNLPSRANNLREAIKIIYHTGGYRAFFKGLVPRTVFQVPGTAVSWSVYEFFKYSLKLNNNNENDKRQL
jgi:solute carrier family 25 iron transporter 28/37